MMVSREARIYDHCRYVLGVNEAGVLWPDIRVPFREVAVHPSANEPALKEALEAFGKAFQA